MCRHNQGTEALAETGDKIEGPGWTVTEELDAMKNFTQLAEQRVHLQAGPGAKLSSNQIVDSGVMAVNNLLKCGLVASISLGREARTFE